MEEDDLAKMYAAEAEYSLSEEAKARIAEVVNPLEDIKLRSLSLVSLVDDGNSGDLVKALMARLGDVRAALIGHGGGLMVDSCEVTKGEDGSPCLDLQLNLDGACVSCGAAPGTLESIHNDLLADPEVAVVKFTRSMLDSYDSLIREFLEFEGKVTFV